MKKIAIIGSGISGLTCAHILDKHHDVTVFEKMITLVGTPPPLILNIKARRFLSTLALSYSMIEPTQISINSSSNWASKGNPPR